jgi:aryl-alcohol dehydrogenase-like predicted oxidoreductase
MRYRPLGTSGLTVSEIGFGAWGIGGATVGETSYGATDDRRSSAALERALDLGVTFFDTSNVYGDGHSEALIGAAFAGNRERVVIATKAGLIRFGAAADFSPESLRRSLDGSLARLGCDYVDLLQLHNPPADLFVRAPESYDALETFRREGKVRALGLSVRNPADAPSLIEGHRIDALQINLNMLDLRAHESGLLALATRRGIGVIARTPLCFGFLSGAVGPETRFPPGDHRRTWPRAQLERWSKGARAMQDAAGAAEGQSWSQVALRFCLSFPEVASVIPGMLGPEEVVENARASELGPLAPEARDRVVALNRTLEIFQTP